MAIAVGGRGSSPIPPHQPGTGPSAEVDPAPDTPQDALTILGDQLAEARGYDWDKRQNSLDPRSGYPQRLYFKPGRMVCVEYLSPGDEMSKAQVKWADIIDAIAERSNDTIVRVAVDGRRWLLLREALT